MIVEQQYLGLDTIGRTLLSNYMPTLCCSGCHSVTQTKQTYRTVNCVSRIVSLRIIVNGYCSTNKYYYNYITVCMRSQPSQRRDCDVPEKGQRICLFQPRGGTDAFAHRITGAGSYRLLGRGLASDVAMCGHVATRPPFFLWARAGVAPKRTPPSGVPSALSY